jgi:hypothetical protein
MKSEYTLYFSFLLLLVIAGCSQKIDYNDCESNPNLGSLNGGENTQFAELSPVYYNNSLYYSFDAGEDGIGLEVLRTDKGGIEPIVDFLFNDFQLYSTPFLYTDEQGTVSAVFSGRFYNEEYYKIYKSVYLNGFWAKPMMVDLGGELSDNIFPSISPDSRTMYFSSNREGSAGGHDIYYSEKVMNAWSTPMNIGLSINNEFDQLNPVQDESGSLYFSSRDSTNSQTDIYYAIYKNGLYQDAQKLPEPVNSESNEPTFTISNGDIYLSSDREGGCGSFDLYKFQICNSISITGRVYNTDGKAITDGTLKLNDLGSGTSASLYLDSDGRYNKSINESGVYTLSYKSECIDETLVTKPIKAACNPTKPTKYVQDIIIGKKQPVFTFEDYNFPFFSTGYYKPLTTLNLEELKQQLEYGVFNNNKATSYINEPTEIYDQLSPQIDEAIGDATMYIYNLMNRLDSECSAVGESMEIEILGYADPRPIPKGSKYVGPDLSNEAMGIQIKSGATMDNMLLSKLRAYYTALELKKIITKHPKYKELSDKVTWNVKGSGVDKDPDKELLFKRHVSVEIKATLERSL